MERKFRILIPFDFSETAMNALRYVREFIGTDRNVEIVLGYVVPSGNLEEFSDNRNRIEELQKDFRVPLHLEIVAGSIGDELSLLAAKEQTDLVFAGSASRGNIGISRATMLALKAHCPVIIIPSGYTEFRMERIVLALGHDRIRDKRLLETLLKVARRFRARVELLTVKDEERDFGYSSIDEANEGDVAYYLEQFYSHHAFVEGAEVGPAILAHLAQKEVDLLTILPRNHAELPLTSEGKLTTYLCENTEVPVLVIDR